MTVGELKSILTDIPDDFLIDLCTDGGNPYDDYWEVTSVIRISEYTPKDNIPDRICFIG